MTQHQNEVPKSFIRTISMLHIAILIAMIAFTLFVYYTGDQLKIDAYPDGNIFLYIVPIASIVAYFASSTIYKNAINKIPKKLPLQNKLARFQSASLIKYAILEAPVFLALIAYLQSSYALFLTIAMALLLYFYSQRPTEEKIKKALSL